MHEALCVCVCVLRIHSASLLLRFCASSPVCTLHQCMWEHTIFCPLYRAVNNGHLTCIVRRLSIVGARPHTRRSPVLLIFLSVYIILCVFLRPAATAARKIISKITRYKYWTHQRISFSHRVQVGAETQSMVWVRNIPCLVWWIHYQLFGLRHCWSVASSSNTIYTTWLFMRK